MASSVSRRKVLKEFIETYKSHPCLWQIKSKDYHNREKKASAYELLLQKLREIEPDANQAEVLKKINNLRSNVRKERKKYDQSLKSGASADDVYHPKLWYYDLFDFINDQCTPRESSSNLDNDDNSCEGDNTQNSPNSDQLNSPHTVSTDNSETESAYSNNNLTRPPKPNKSKKKDDTLTNELLESVRDHFKRPRPITTEDRCDVIGKNVAMMTNELLESVRDHFKRPRPITTEDRCDVIGKNVAMMTNELLESVRDHFKRPRPITTEDRCDVIGKNVAMKLRALDTKQRLVAEKLINDLLFEAEIGNLTPEHAYINMRDILRQNQRSQQNWQQVYCQSPTSNRSYTPGRFASSLSPSPSFLPSPSTQHSENQLGGTQVYEQSISESSAATFFPG